MYRKDSIAALATPKGIGALAIIRVSGEELCSLFKKITKKKTPVPRLATLSSIYCPTTKKTLDSAIIIYFKAPFSFTGEDLIEITCHGGHYIASSILERAGSKTFNGNQGKSFLPVLLGETPLRDEALIEYNDSGCRLGFPEPARVRSVITRDWRYTVYKDCDWGELYNLKSDPDETENLWESSAFTSTKSYFSERLNHHLIAQMDESPLSDRLA